jgi:hypothetical protein
MSKRLILALGLGTLLAGNAWAQLPVGPEFRVNAYTTGAQATAAVATDQAGNFVVVWASDGQDGAGSGIFARRYLASGTPVGSSEFRVNAYTTSSQQDPAVASDPTGRLVVLWTSTGQDGSQSGVYGRRYDAAGTPGPEFQVNTYTSLSQFASAAAMNASGQFVAVWTGYGQDDPNFVIRAQRYDAGGTLQGAEFRVNSYTTGTQIGPKVAMDPAGNFVVVWYSAQDGSGYGVFGQRYDAAGLPQGPEFRVNSYTTGSQGATAVAMDAGGNFIVAWESTAQDGDGQGLFAQRYNAAGAPQGGEFQINQYTTGPQERPRVAMQPDGRFVVAWSGQDGNDRGVLARAYDSAGQPEGNEFLVNAFTTGTQVNPAVAPVPGVGFVAAWESNLQDGSANGVFGRRFATDLIFRDGFESGDLSNWSSAAVDGGDLLLSSAAALKFTSVGLQGVVDDTASLYVQDDTPVDEDRYRARFYFDTNGFDPGESAGAHRTRVFIAFEEGPTRRLAAIVLKRTAGTYSVMGRARLDDNTQADTGFFDISPGAHFVELEWKRSSGPSANDGTFQLWIDGVSVSTLLNLDNSQSAVDFARMGALSVKAGATGTLYWDEFESRRFNYIGN